MKLFYLRFVIIGYSFLQNDLNIAYLNCTNLHFDY